MEGKLLLAKTELIQTFETEYSKAFKVITNLKVGDLVRAYFSTNHGNYKNSYTTLGLYDGILKEYNNGILFIESVKELKRSEYVEEYKKGGFVYNLSKRTVNIDKISLSETLNIKI